MTLPRNFRALLQAENGSIAINFAIAALPLVMLSGVAVDVTRSNTVKADLQNAADSAVLAIARTKKESTDLTTLKTFAKQYMTTMLPEGYDFEITSMTKASSTVKLTAEGTLPSGISGVMGFDELSQNAAAEAVWGTGKLEVALVLDNTGSMSEFSRMAEMKTAANALLSELESSEAGLVKVAIVPFDVNVRVPTSSKTASWFKGDWWVNWFWKGCLTDRDQPNDASDATVTTSTSTKYPAALCSSDKLATILPLTGNFTDLYAKVAAMTPAGNTNITIGVSWGQAVLSAQEPYTEGVAAGTPDVSKIMVLMTDGANTENRWSSSASTIDARTALACQSVKNAGITLYTVRFMEGNGTLLQNCASDLDSFYDVENVEDLVPAFRAIGERLTQLRVAS